MVGSQEAQMGLGREMRWIVVALRMSGCMCIQQCCKRRSTVDYHRWDSIVIHSDCS